MMADSGRVAVSTGRETRFMVQPVLGTDSTPSVPLPSGGIEVPHARSQRQAEGARLPSILDYLTDGSLAALCDELSLLTGVRVRLLDEKGRVISRRDPSASGGKGAWQVEADSARDFPGSDQDVVVPLTLGSDTIGSLVIGTGEPSLPEDARVVLERALSHLARTTTELCEHEHDLRMRMKEVTAMYRVSSLVARAIGPDQVLKATLESVLDAMELDAGAIMLLKQDADGVTSDREEDLVQGAALHLSKDWLDCPSPLSKERLFDRLALDGVVVMSEDVTVDPRVLIPERAKAEGLAATIQAGLIFQNRPIGVIRLYSRVPRIFREADARLLRSIAQQAAVAVEQARLLTLERSQQKVERQLELAADVQRRMLPKANVERPGFDIAARYQPTMELGGDFYDYLDLNGHIGITVGDVVGKGIAAALFMSAVRASLRAHAQQVYNLDEVVERVNKALCRDTRDNEFASLWYGVIDPGTLRLTYCSAGHEPTLVVKIPKGRPPTLADIDTLGVGGMVVGIDPQQKYQRSLYDLKPGNLLVAYTDGVLDAANFQGERFGKVRLREAILRTITNNPDLSAAEFVDKVLWEIRQFVGLSTRSDDITILAVRVLERGRKK
jgi:phosphoserine phosphatase RsbU/P